MWILTYDGIMDGVLKCHWAQSVRKRTGSNSASHVKTVQENIRTPIPDNLKSAVKNADRYEPVINESYLAMAEHYGTVIITARPYKPKDKAKAENGVLIVERWLLARIRNETFHTLRALNIRLRELLGELNNRPMKGYGNQTRAERFRILDAPALSALPAAPYEYAEYRAVKVAPDYHVEYARHWCSVPHELGSASVAESRSDGDPDLASGPVRGAASAQPA